MATTTLTNSLGMLNKADYENVVAGANVLSFKNIAGQVKVVTVV